MGIPVEGFAWKIWIKWHKITVFLGEWTFFKIWEYDNSLFFRDIWSQKRQFCQKHTILRGKKKMSIWCSFFPIFYKKSMLSCPYFFKKLSFSKNTLPLCPHFVKKTYIISKTLWFHVIFSNFLWKTPCCYAHV